MNIRIYGLGLAALTLSAIGASRAQAITLQSGSMVYAYASDGSYGTPSSETNDVNALPYSTPAKAWRHGASSNVDPMLTSDALNLTFDEKKKDSHASPNGYGEIYFTAAPNVDYTISGSETLSGKEDDSTFKTTLFNMTTNQYVYDYSKNASHRDRTLTLNSSGGDMTGTLIAGDTYEYFSSIDLGSQCCNGCATGGTCIAFTQCGNGGCCPTAVPLPPAAWTSATFLGGMIAVLSLKKRMVA